MQNMIINPIRLSVSESAKIVGIDQITIRRAIQKQELSCIVGVYDHVHRGSGDPGHPYRFDNAGKLIEDFWVEVERIMREEER